MQSEEEFLEALNTQISLHINWLADIEATSAIVGGPAAQGTLIAEKNRLLDWSGRIIDRLQHLNGQKP